MAVARTMTMHGWAKDVHIQYTSRTQLDSVVLLASESTQEWNEVDGRRSTQEEDTIYGANLFRSNPIYLCCLYTVRYTYHATLNTVLIFRVREKERGRSNQSPDEKLRFAECLYIVYMLRWRDISCSLKGWVSNNPQKQTNAHTNALNANEYIFYFPYYKYRKGRFRVSED